MKKLILLFSMIVVSLQGFAQLSRDSVNYFYTDDSTRLYVKKSGNGPICIFIHGGPGAWSKSFEALGGDQLEKSLTMVYYDQRGSGRSESPSNGDYSLARMLDDIDEIRQHYGEDKVYLLAHSFGGIIATNYAYKYGMHVKGLIMANATLDMRASLINQIGYVNDLLGTNYKQIDSSFSAVKTAFLSARKALADSGLQFKMLSDSKANVDLVDDIDRLSPSDYGFAKHVFDMPIYWKDYRNLSALIKVPVLVITGKNDHAIGIKHYLGFKYPSQQIVQLPSGHIDYFENNRTFKEAVLKFIKNCDK